MIRGLTEEEMKLSELTYEYLQSIGLQNAHMHTDCSDGLRSMHNEYHFNDAKSVLMANYGDVNLIINPDAAWFDQIKIDDAKWKADHEAFCRQKGEWCKKFGAE